jgi:tetratricopeptide (TPR) repeat protein
MKNKRALTLVFFLVFGLISAGLAGCSFPGGNPLSKGTSQALSPDHPYKIAKEYQRRHENSLGESIEHYRRALDDPETADLARFELGLIFYKTGDFEEAIQHLEGLKGSCPDRFLASKILGISHVQQRQVQGHLHARGEGARVELL